MNTYHIVIIIIAHGFFKNNTTNEEKTFFNIFLHLLWYNKIMIGGSMKLKKTIILVLAFISLGIFIISTAYTYAKYYTKENGTIGSNIKRWDIKINNESIINGTSLTNDITAYIDDDTNVAEDNIAPGTHGYFLIDVDYTNVDLSFSYDISIVENATIPDIEITKVEVDGVEYNAQNGHITGQIDVATATEKTKEIKVYIRWNDDENDGATMSDAEDTEVAIENEEINFDVNILIVQLAS